MKERLEDTFGESLSALAGDPSSRKFLLAVSGGKDSSVLAHLFHSRQINFEIAHCNFHLREEDSDQDMGFVLEMGLEYRCPVHLKEFYHEDFESLRGKSIEMIAREFRYQWFEKLAPSYDFIVTAHHANDNAETLLLNLVRGSGLRGLAGIPPRNGKIIRPLLPFSSDEIEEYARRHNLSYQVDRTNLVDRYQRNKIRLNVIPRLEEINPSLIHTMRQNIRIFQRQYRFYDQQIQQIRQKVCLEKGGRFFIDKEALLAYTDHFDLLIHELLSPFGFNEETIRSIARNWRKQPGKKYYSPAHIALQERKRLVIMKIKPPGKKPLVLPDGKALEKYGFEIAYCKKEKGEVVVFENNPRIWYVDAQLLEFPVTLRHWEHGDKFQPLGMGGTKKVSDFFNDQKIDNYAKNDLWIFCVGEKIAWLVGYRSDHRFRITGKTEEYYKITYHGSI